MERCEIFDYLVRFLCCTFLDTSPWALWKVFVDIDKLQKIVGDVKYKQIYEANHFADVLAKTGVDHLTMSMCVGDGFYYNDAKMGIIFGLIRLCA